MTTARTTDNTQPKSISQSQEMKMTINTDTLSPDSALDFLLNNDIEVGENSFKKIEKIVAASAQHSFLLVLRCILEEDFLPEKRQSQKFQFWPCGTQ